MPGAHILSWTSNYSHWVGLNGPDNFKFKGEISDPGDII